LEEYLRDPNFEQNRIEYKTNKALADGKIPNKAKSTPRGFFLLGISTCLKFCRERSAHGSAASRGTSAQYFCCETKDRLHPTHDRPLGVDRGVSADNVQPPYEQPVYFVVPTEPVATTGDRL
jgi:hypothetical protein